MKPLPRCLALLVALCCLFPAAALAQLKNQDTSALISELRDQGMTELLDHLVNTEQFDPVEKLTIRANQSLMIAQDPKRPLEQRREAMTAAVERYRALVRENAADPQRPMWQTELVQTLLAEYLPLVAPGSAEFYEFGVPSVEQKSAFEFVAALAFENAVEADLRFAELQGELPRNAKEWTEKYINTGLQQRMFGDYYNNRLQFFLGQAALYLTLLPDSHPYYAKENLAQPPRKPTPQEERRRLAQIAVDRCEPFLRRRDDTVNAVKPLCQSIVGRALVALGRYDNAVAELDKLARLPKTDLNQLLSILGKAKAYAQANKTSDFQAAIDAASAHPVVRMQVGYRLLVTDLMFRTKMLKAATQPAALADAYKVYEDLFKDPTIDAKDRESLKSYVGGRWASTIDPRQDLTKLDTMVLMALVEGSAVECRETQGDYHANLEVLHQGGVRDVELARQVALIEAAVAGYAGAAEILKGANDARSQADNLRKQANAGVMQALEKVDAGVADYEAACQKARGQREEARKLESKVLEARVLEIKKYRDDLAKALPGSDVPEAWANAGAKSLDDVKKLIEDALKLAEQDRAAREQAERDAEAMTAGFERALSRALRSADVLLSRPGLPDESKAKVRFSRALATYFANVSSRNLLLAAARQWTELAEQMPEQRAAEEGLAAAAALLKKLHEDPEHRQAVQEAFDRAMKVLLSPKFDKTKAADGLRAYYAFAVLDPAGRLEEAVAQYDKVPPGHPAYYEARREMLYGLKKLHDQAPPDKKDAARRRVVEAAAKLKKECLADLPAKDDPGGTGAVVAQPKGEAEMLIYNTMGHCRLILAEMALEQRPPDFNAALKELEGFEQAFSDNADMLRRGLAFQIVALVEANRLEEAVQAHQAMMEKYPDAAAAVTERDVLPKIEQRARTLRDAAEAGAVMAQSDRDELLGRSARLYAAAEVFGRRLIEWAQKRNIPEADMLPARLGYARSLRLAGKIIESADLLDKLYKDKGNADNADVIHELAEALFATDKPDKLAAAARHYIRLINSLKQDAQRRYPPMWWNAWMRSVQIMDKTNKEPASIPTRVKQLRAFDLNLGGDPYEKELERLERKWLAPRK